MVYVFSIQTFYRSRILKAIKLKQKVSYHCITELRRSQNEGKQSCNLHVLLAVVLHCYSVLTSRVLELSLMFFKRYNFSARTSCHLKKHHS